MSQSPLFLLFPRSVSPDPVSFIPVYVGSLLSPSQKYPGSSLFSLSHHKCGLHWISSTVSVVISSSPQANGGSTSLYAMCCSDRGVSDCLSSFKKDGSYFLLEDCNEGSCLPCDKDNEGSCLPGTSTTTSLYLSIVVCPTLAFAPFADSLTSDSAGLFIFSSALCSSEEGILLIKPILLEFHGLSWSCLPHYEDVMIFVSCTMKLMLPLDEDILLHHCPPLPLYEVFSLLIIKLVLFQEVTDWWYIGLERSRLLHVPLLLGKNDLDMCSILVYWSLLGFFTSVFSFMKYVLPKLPPFLCGYVIRHFIVKMVLLVVESQIQPFYHSAFFDADLLVSMAFEAWMSRGEIVWSCQYAKEASLLEDYLTIALLVMFLVSPLSPLLSFVVFRFTNRLINLLIKACALCALSSHLVSSFDGD